MKKTLNLRRPSSSGEVADRWLGGETVEYPLDVPRPQVRGDCLEGGINAQRPCGFVSCAHHLYLDIKGHSIKLNFPTLEVWELPESCSLDVADRGQASLPELSKAMNLSYERSWVQIFETTVFLEDFA